MQYDKTFKEEAVRLSDEIGPKKAAEQLGIPYGAVAFHRRLCNSSAKDKIKNEIDSGGAT